MVGQDGKPTADEKGDEEKIEKMTIANPKRKSVRPCEVVGIDYWNGWNAVQPGDHQLDPRRHGQQCNECDRPNCNGRPDPDSNAAILGVMNGPMLSTKSNHSHT